MLDPARIALVILAGGEGSRLGARKTRLRVGGQAILEDLLLRMNWPGEKLLIARRDDATPAGHDAFDQVLFDLEENQGPLAGVMTAIQYVETARERIEALCVVAIDMHHLSAEHTRRLIATVAAASAKIAMFRRSEGDSRVIEPLPLFIHADGFGAIKAYYDSGERSLRGLLKLAGAKAIIAPPVWGNRPFAGINTLDEMNRAGLDVFPDEPDIE